MMSPLSRARARTGTRIVPGPRGEVHVRAHYLHIPCRPRARARGPSRRRQFSHQPPPSSHMTAGIRPHFLLLVLILLLRCLPTVAVVVALGGTSSSPCGWGLCATGLGARDTNRRSRDSTTPVGSGCTTCAGIFSACFRMKEGK